MVVFVDGQPKPSEYRRFRIKSVRGANDFASMQEVLRRRFRRAGDSATDEGETWALHPDLLIVDGGKGQLSAAHDIMRDSGVGHIPLAGLAKRNEELFLVDEPEPVVLPRTSQALYLVQRIRDEAHRFAITYHRNVRHKEGMRSALDNVPGIGPKRKKALLRKFGSVQRIRDASPEDVAATPGFTSKLAQTVKEHL
jgi:excinuclease ABC subunit C